MDPHEPADKSNSITNQKAQLTRYAQDQGFRNTETVKKYLYLAELTPAILNDLVKAVYVHAPDKSSGHRVQDVDISYNYIGILPASLLNDLINGTAA